LPRALRRERISRAGESEQGAPARYEQDAISRTRQLGVKPVLFPGVVVVLIVIVIVLIDIVIIEVVFVVVIVFFVRFQFERRRAADVQIRAAFLADQRVSGVEILFIHIDCGIAQRAINHPSSPSNTPVARRAQN